MTINGSFVGDGRLLVGNMSVAAPARQGATASHYQIDVGSAKSITLEVGFGNGYDVQDRFLWIEPALLRN